MKKTTQDIKSGITMGIVFVLTILFSGIVYATISHVNTGDSLTAAKWNELVDLVNSTSFPTGMVAPFDLSTCPSGWSLADGNSGHPDLRGQFIRGLDNGRNIDNGRVLASTQDGSTKLLMNGSVSPSNPGESGEGNSPNGIIAHIPANTMIGINTGFWGQYTARYSLRSAMDTNWGGANETRPTNVALLYCIKN